MDYIYETHLHTCEGSACGVSHGRDYIPFMKEKGYSGIIVTDHFFNGNCSVPPFLPWEERCARYCGGYEQAKAAERGGLAVFFGMEFNFEGDEYLIYGVDRDWLISNPDLLSLSRREVYARVHQAGSIMVQAHPYRERGYLSAIHLTPSICDGAEVYNAGNLPYMDALAREYTQRHRLRQSAGSDIHYLHNGSMGGMRFSHRLESIRDYVESFLAGEGTPVMRFPDGRFVPVSEVPERCEITRRETLPVIWH